MSAEKRQARVVGAVLVSLVFCLGAGATGCSRHLRAGERAPDVTLTAQDGTPVTLSRQWRDHYVVLYFYPMDDTPGCRKQACFFRDLNAEYEAAGARIFGVSVDGVASHRRFAQKYSLPFTLLADTEKKATKHYGVTSALLPGKSARVTFVIDRQGVIRRVYPDVDLDTHGAEVLDFIRELRKADETDATRSRP